MAVHDPFDPVDPRSAQLPGPRGGAEPDPEPILRRVRTGFVIGAMLLAGLVFVALHPIVTAPPRPNRTVTALVAAGVLVLAVVGYRAMRPGRLVAIGKQALRPADRREVTPRRERARRLGMQGLAMSWATEAMTIALVPALCGVVLMVLHRLASELYGFAAASLVVGVLLLRQVTRAVRLAAGDRELWTAYGGG